MHQRFSTNTNIPMPVSLFQGSSDVSMAGCSWMTHVGDVYLDGPRGAKQLEALRNKVEKNKGWNHYSPDTDTVRVPRFSKSLLDGLDGIFISTEDTEGRPEDSGSCAYQLMFHLKLLPGQINSAKAEYDIHIPIDRLTGRSNCYCGRISRHGLVLLISRHFQNADLDDNTRGGSRAVLSTTIGRFIFHENEDKTFVHFDGDVRSSYNPLVPGQQIDDIVRAAQGKYLVNRSTEASGFEWTDISSSDELELSTRVLFGVPNAISYMPKKTIEMWRGLHRFAAALLDAVIWVTDTLTEPDSFVCALNNLPDESIESFTEAFEGTPAEKLAGCVPHFRWIAKRKASLMVFEYFCGFTTLCTQYVLSAHQHYRQSDRIQLDKLIDTSQDRFKALLNKYFRVGNTPGTEDGDSLRHDLREVLRSNTNNVALVVFQGYFAILALWNAGRVLERAREAPQWWVRFVAADDGEIFIG